MNAPDELRPLTAGELLDVRRRTADEDWDTEERALRRNAAVLALCCYKQGERAFLDGDTVLRDLTVHRMEELLGRLLRGGGALEPPPGAVNAGFDAERFQTLRGRD